jgi:FMN phosphatase YigB (HAD superfamily)
MIKGIIFDWGRTLYDPEAGALFPGTLSVLQSLAQKYRLAVVSLVGDGDVKRRWRIFKEAGVAQFFMSTQFATGNKPALFAAALRDLGLTASEVAIVDDRVVRGIAWGNQHGAITIWVKRGKFSDETPDRASGAPRHVIRNLSELPVLQL